MPDIPAGPSHRITIRLEIDNRPGQFAKVATVIGDLGGNLGAVDIVSVGKGFLIRDLTIDTRGEDHAANIVAAVKKIQGIKIRNVSDRVFLLHLGGKITVQNKIPVNTRDALSMAYTPGVARVCRAIAEDRSAVYNLTIKRNTVGIVTDGTAVLGLGDIGPEAAMPVMEGKAMLFKEFGDVDAFPICLKTKETEEIIRIVEAISPGFGGINLEDISAPRCFEIEERLKERLDIPVFHDDQHGTAVVVSAALINAMKLVHKTMSEIKVVILGVGAAGVACTKMMMNMGVRHIIGVDRAGIVYQGREKGMNVAKQWFAENTNHENLQGSIVDAAKGADVFLGLSGPNTFPLEALKLMARDPVVFALANPDPEISPEEAAGHCRIMATGRSDYPNQINNVLCFPGIFRGALNVQASDINEEMKVAAARAIADTIPVGELTEEYIIPSVFDRRVFKSVANAVAKAAIETGVAKRKRKQKE
ncbi:MAG: NAD-dependent malic enzyme [Candidatus Omnitrophota bacterium]|jgi:malate dehydrogenase (oxaloacetate-decarboxylating)|nr:MAG: NAD-dependent malic enzyme [Candidatus Omnitrophota bacterium]